jgi:hypothetical protein
LDLAEDAWSKSNVTDDPEIHTQLAQLEKHHIKVSDWRLEPLEIVGRDFVSSLLHEFVAELR